MFPLRVVVETVQEHECTKCSDGGETLTDSYAIVSGQTPLSQLVDTVLCALGFQQLAYGAKGLIQMKNWKPLSFDQITENPECTVESILKDISNHLTLKILTKQADTAVRDCVSDLKGRLLKAALNRNPQILGSLKNQQLKEFVNQMIRGEPHSHSVTIEQIQGFNNWLEEICNWFSNARAEKRHEQKRPLAVTTEACGGGATTTKTGEIFNPVSFSLELNELLRQQREGQMTVTEHSAGSGDSGIEIDPDTVMKNDADITNEAGEDNSMPVEQGRSTYYENDPTFVLLNSESVRSRRPRICHRLKLFRRVLHGRSAGIPTTPSTYRFKNRRAKCKKLQGLADVKDERERERERASLLTNQRVELIRTERV